MGAVRKPDRPLINGLLLPVLFDVRLGRVPGMIRGMHRVCVGQMGVMCRLFMVARLVMFGRFAVMSRSVRVMFGGVLMMLCSFL